MGKRRGKARQLTAFGLRAPVGMPSARAGLSPALPSPRCCRSCLSRGSLGQICQRSGRQRIAGGKIRVPFRKGKGGRFRDPLLSLRDGLFSTSTLTGRAAMPSGYQGCLKYMRRFRLLAAVWAGCSPSPSLLKIILH